MLTGNHYTLHTSLDASKLRQITHHRPTLGNQGRSHFLGSQGQRSAGKGQRLGTEGSSAPGDRRFCGGRLQNFRHFTPLPGLLDYCLFQMSSCAMVFRSLCDHRSIARLQHEFIKGLCSIKKRWRRFDRSLEISRGKVWLKVFLQACLTVSCRGENSHYRPSTKISALRNC